MLSHNLLPSRRESGVSLIIVFFIMVTIIAAVLSVSSSLYQGIKIIRNIGNSVVAFYAADSGIEKVLYYDRKVLSPNGTRGLCQMCDQENSPSCPSDAPEGSLNCSCRPSVIYRPPSTTGCKRNKCDNCTVTFTTEFDGKSYTIEATVFPNKKPYDMEVKASGAFGGVSRALNIITGGQ